MNTPNKLTPEQIAAGWIEIESEGQLSTVPDCFCELLAGNGHRSKAFVVKGLWYTLDGIEFPNSIMASSIAYRPLPSYEEHEKLKNRCESSSRTLRAWQHKTLRDEIAIGALTGLISKLPVIDQTGEFGVVVEDKVQYNRDIADSCYEIADAMLEARKGGAHGE